MHGSSSVPQPLQDTFNQFGGEIAARTWGVPVEEIVRGIRMAVRKVNIGHRLPAGDDRGGSGKSRPRAEANSIRANSLNPRWTRCATSAVSVSSNSVRPANAFEDQGRSVGRNGKTLSRGSARPAHRSHGRRRRMTRVKSGSTGHTIEEKSHE